MKLINLLNEIDGVKVQGSTDVEINNVYNDSRKVEKGDMYVAIKGYEADRT
jgi:UDP-N-acetylmuramoyl-L-alanyl-D-glutamate--2,6-diaminopimelate ligase